MADFTWLDYIIFLFFLIPTLMGLARGIIRELISLAAIVIAIIIVIKFTLPLAHFLYYTQGSRDVIAFISRFIVAEWGRYLAIITLDISTLLLFIGTMSVCEAVNYYFFQNIFMSAALSFMYRVTGAVVGLIRGYIFNVVLLLVLSVTPLQYNSAWQQSHFVPKLIDSVTKLGEKIEPNGYGKFSETKSDESASS